MKRIIITVIVTIVMVCMTAVAFADTAVTPTPDTSWYFGNENVMSYTLYTADQLAGFAELLHARVGIWSGKTVMLGADIDLSSYGKNYNDGRGWIPIWVFSGTFDGNNKTISGLYINAPETSYVGLFSILFEDSSVKNLRLVDVDITGGNYTGGLVAGSFGTWPSNIGGFTIENCSVTGIVRGRDFVGGLIGQSYHGRIINCYTDATVIGNNDVGGVVGIIDLFNRIPSSIESSFSAGTVSGNDNVGGVVGLMDLGGRITNCYSTANVSGNNRVGGILGFRRGQIIWPHEVRGYVEYCYATGVISGNTRVGGIIGSATVYAFAPLSVALNPKIQGNENVSRICFLGGNDPAQGCRARSDMIVLENGAIKTPLDKGTSRPDGADVSIEEVLTATFWRNTMEWNIPREPPWVLRDVWDIADGRLPILKNISAPQNPTINFICCAPEEPCADCFDVPLTGVSSVTAIFMAMLAFFVASILLWGSAVGGPPPLTQN